MWDLLTLKPMITLQGDFRDPIMRKRNGKTEVRDLIYGSYSFTGLAWVLQKSDLVLTAPTLLLNCYEEFFPIRYWPCPVDVEKIEVQMIWHSQTHENPLRIWLRKK